MGQHIVTILPPWKEVGLWLHQTDLLVDRYTYHTFMIKNLNERKVIPCSPSRAVEKSFLRKKPQFCSLFAHEHNGQANLGHLI